MKKKADCERANQIANSIHNYCWISSCKMSSSNRNCNCAEEPLHQKQPADKQPNKTIRNVTINWEEKKLFQILLWLNTMWWIFIFISLCTQQEAHIQWPRKALRTKNSATRKFIQGQKCFRIIRSNKLKCINYKRYNRLSCSRSFCSLSYFCSKQSPKNTLNNTILNIINKVCTQINQTVSNLIVRRCWLLLFL